MKRLLVVCMLMIMAACAPDELKEQKMPDESLSTGGEQTAPAVIPSTQENAQESAVESASDHDASMDDAAGINIDKSDPDWKSKLQLPELMSFEPGQEIIWKLETNVGDMRFKLFSDIAPMHVTSTIYLTELGFYDDVIFHRVITGFMAQGGDPLGIGRGGPGYQYDGEFSPQARHDRPGLLSMANRGPGTDGSQFFITFVPTPWLDGKHTIFGEIVSGEETIAELETRGSRSGKTSERLVIIRASIERAM
ncbi:peptidylprolyl isomerase [Gammaproteobacteria bacterium]|nr:peptidylprolyl isomerase [Gammaproteobacteria bacterium]